MPLLSFVEGLTGVAAAFLGPLYAIFVLEVGGSVLVAAVSWAVFSLSAGIVALFLGKIDDRLKETEFAIALGYLLTAVGFLGFLLVDAPAALFIAQVLLGVGFGLHRPALVVAFARSRTRKRDTAQWYAWQGRQAIVAAGGALLGGVVVHIAGFPMLFILLAAVSLVGAILLLTLPR